jgi:lipopolysaccharide transport system ATP-binding protein
MSQPVISIENLSKSYQLGTIGTGTFYGDLKRWWARQRGKPDPYLKVGENDYGNHQGKTIWALKDINFTVQQGEALGIIGHNGAGKSTLLKILSQVTMPTSGMIKVKGRIASLLEVGTGFHPELTGRENIYLNGAIMGMSRAEVNRKLDEIVDFSGVEQFIDTPVKRYSSGMYVRLAFAVAAHLEPEILIVDEVLAVGDAEFQKKCLGKMGDVAYEGRTVLFVSHNMGAISNLCRSIYWLERGKLHLNGPTEYVVSQYLTQNTTTSGICTWQRGIANENVKDFFISEVSLRAENGEPISRIDAHKPFWVEIHYTLLDDLTYCRIGFSLVSDQGITLFETYDSDYPEFSGKRLRGSYVLRCKIPEQLLNTRRYFISVNAGIPNIRHLAYLDSILVFDVFDIRVVGSQISLSREGSIRPILEWQQKTETR